MSILQTIIMWLKAIISNMTAPPPIALPAPGSSRPTLVDIMLNWSRDFGPSLKTGGYIKKITRPQAQTLSDIIYKVSAQTGMSVEMIAAGIAGESRFDAQATNPNYQDAKHPNETPHETFMHTDLGLCQFDGAVLAADPEFAGKMDAEIRACAYDPEWAVPKFAAHVQRLLNDAVKEVAADPTLLDNVKNHDIRILAVEGYNKGEHGARLAEQHMPLDAKSMSYGESWIQRVEDYTALLKG